MSIGISYASLSAGMQTEFGTWLSPGSLVTYVHHSGGRASDIEPIRSRTLSTLNSGLAQCRAGMGDAVVILEGHAENITGADQMSSLVANTKIIGLGRGVYRPTFTWTAAGSTFLFDVAGTQVYNCILNTSPDSGSVTVTAPITISAAGCGLYGVQMRTSVDSSSLSTIPITTTAAADNLEILDTKVYGATAGECTTLIDLIGCDYLRIERCVFKAATASTAVGVVRFATTASTHIELRDNSYNNKKAASTCAVTGLANTSGLSFNESFGYLDNASLTPWLTSVGLMVFHRPTVSNNTGETGSEVVGTVSA